MRPQRRPRPDPVASKCVISRPAPDTPQENMPHQRLLSPSLGSSPAPQVSVLLSLLRIDVAP
jgi:hypothetical protein